MGHATPIDDQARYRAELRRSGALRNGMVTAALRQAWLGGWYRLEAWLRELAAAKQATSRPRSSAG